MAIISQFILQITSQKTQTRPTAIKLDRNMQAN